MTLLHQEPQFTISFSVVFNQESTRIYLFLGSFVAHTYYKTRRSCPSPLSVIKAALTRDQSGSFPFGSDPLRHGFALILLGPHGVGTALDQYNSKVDQNGSGLM